MSVRTIAAVIAAVFGFASAAFAADPPKQGWSFGKDQYMARCAPCHGANGKGAGPAAKQVGATVPDITTYAKRNGGKMPEKQAWAIIDARQLDDRVQQDRAMPVWGHTFKTQARAEERADVEPYVRARIAAVLAYLKTLQVK